MGQFLDIPQKPTKYLDGPFCNISEDVVRCFCGFFGIYTKETVQVHFNAYHKIPHDKLDEKYIDELLDTLDLIHALKRTRDIDLTKEWWFPRGDNKQEWHIKNSWRLKFLDQWEKLSDDEKDAAPCSRTVAWFCEAHKLRRDKIIGQEEDIKTEIQKRLGIDKLVF